ncbi:NAD kinase [Heterocephalus glaber]|uniref:NAD kinase n=1 Tax=Heterocephalus glaber TaxID=10181 RepID=G5ASQ6_HETGA|nr:NAD kinase [Heterocephalus glaber]
MIVSTPTGSTVYAAAAGGSMIHPNVPAIMITPICPHSLTFQPIVVPAGVELKITLSPEARNTAWVSLDGRKRQEIRHGDSITIATSCYPLGSARTGCQAPPSRGDGMIVSTPTGSTVYAAAAGGSLLHPNGPAIMITPICPHSLTFQPIVVPAGVELKITLSPEARNTAWVSLDGRKRQEIRHGDSITIATSCYLLPSICISDPVNGLRAWRSVCIGTCTRRRKKQAHFEEEEEAAEDGEEG